MAVLSYYSHRLMVLPHSTPPGRGAETFARAYRQVDRMGQYLYCTEEMWENTDEQQ